MIRIVEGRSVAHKNFPYFVEYKVPAGEWSEVPYACDEWSTQEGAMIDAQQLRKEEKTFRFRVVKNLNFETTNQ